MKVSIKQLINILQDAIALCVEPDMDNSREHLAGQILAYKTYLEVFYPDQTTQVSISQEIVNMLAKANDVK